MEKQKFWEKFIHVLERGLLDVCLAFVLIVVLFAIYTEWDNVHLIEDASAKQYETYKPTSDDTLSFEELQDRNSDVIGWITLDDTSIDYPIVQGKDNNEYINKSVTGAFSLSGAIFLDSRNEKDFSEPLSVVYGHNMTGPAMFGELHEYADEDYLKTHRSGTLYVDGEYYKLKVFACFKSNGHDTEVYRIPLDKKDIPEWSEKIRSIALAKAGSFPKNGRILLLSTCASGQTDERTLVAATVTLGGEAPKATTKTKTPVGRSHIITNQWLNWKGILYLFVLLLLITILYMRRKRK